MPEYKRNLSSIIDVNLLLSLLRTLRGAHDDNPEPLQAGPARFFLKNDMWKIYALLSALFAALTAVFAKAGVKDINSDLATAIRTTVILLLTWGIVFCSRQARGIREIGGHTWLFLVLSGLATGLSWLFYFKALQTGDVSRVAPIDKLSVVITIVLACLFLKEPVTPKVVAGALLITAGSIVLLMK